MPRSRQTIRLAWAYPTCHELNSVTVSTDSTTIAHEVQSDDRGQKMGLGPRGGREGGGGRGGLPPRGVPVPCICTTATSAPATPPPCRACLITPCWEGPLGAVRLLLLPSWFTALPASSAKPCSKPSGTSAAGTRITHPTASART